MCRNQPDPESVAVFEGHSDQFWDGKLVSPAAVSRGPVSVRVTVHVGGMYILQVILGLSTLSRCICLAHKALQPLLYAHRPTSQYTYVHTHTVYAHSRGFSTSVQKCSTEFIFQCMVPGVHERFLSPVSLCSDPERCFKWRPVYSYHLCIQ